MLGFARKKTGKIEEMLAALAPLGVRLNEGRTITDLTADWSRDQIEAKGYELLLVAMGREMVDSETFQSQGWLSDSTWHFDGECVEDESIYTAIVERAVQLAGGDLKLERVASLVDFDNPTAWVEWMSRGTVTRHDLEMDNDWADGKLFGKIDEELAAQGSQKRFFNVPLGQDCVFVCCDNETLSALRKLTGLTFRKLV